MRDGEVDEMAIISPWHSSLCHSYRARCHRSRSEHLITATSALSLRLDCACGRIKANRASAWPRLIALKVSHAVATPITGMRLRFRHIAAHAAVFVAALRPPKNNAARSIDEPLFLSSAPQSLHAISP